MGAADTLTHVAGISNRRHRHRVNCAAMRHCLLLLAALLPLPALGQGFGPVRWDYVAANLALPEIDEIGLEIEGSTAVTRNLVVFGGYREFDPRRRTERTTLSIGVGRRFAIRPNVDVMASAAYADNDLDTRGRDTEEEGVILGGHVRGWLTPRFELNGAVLLDNSTGSSTDMVLEAGGQYFRGRNWSYGGRLRVDEDEDALFLGIRFYFGASRR